MNGKSSAAAQTADGARRATTRASASAFSYPEQPPGTDPTNTDARAPFPVQQAPRPVAKPRTYELSLPEHHGIDSTDPTALGVLELAALLRAGALTSEKLTKALLDRAQEKDSDINSFVHRYPDTALAAARDADARRRAEGDRAPLLCGIPLALKDVFAVQGRPLTAGLPALLGDNIAVGDCTAWARLKADGMPLLGHVQTHQMASPPQPATCAASNPRRDWSRYTAPSRWPGASTTSARWRAAPPISGPCSR
ncbi:amidase family protein [Nocardia sp. NPDC051321]|uniref:amidase family protein n=1 Tax=Nocardia sp. NPDC051321 TaxID=3364323 RepID=UPI00379CA834